MRRMQVLKALLVFACSLLLSCAAAAPAARAAAEEEGVRPNSLEAGSWSLQFQITDDVGLKPFNGMIVSVKRHLSSRSALRLGLRFDIDWEDHLSSDLQQVSDTTYDWYDLSTDEDHQSFSIDLSYLRYVSPGSYMNFFWGVGPLVSFSRSKKVSTRAAEAYGERSNWTYSRAWSVGPLGVVGVEWFLSKHIGFHAEYRAAIIYRRSVLEQEQFDNRTTPRRYYRKDEGENWDFQSVNVILGLSVYF